VAIKEAAQMFIKYKPAGAPAWAEHLPLADLKIAVVPIFIILRQHDAAKATAWLDSLNLPDEMKAELKKPKK